MLKADIAKTALALKPTPQLALVLLLIVSFLASLTWRQPACQYPYANDRQLLLSKTVKLEEVNSPAKLAQGLSGRPCLPVGQGMLFNLKHSGYYPFWMKDMKFSIDMVWVDSEHHVTDVVQKATPGSYPATFINSQPAQYVLEFPAGTAGRFNINPGTTLMF